MNKTTTRKDSPDNAKGDPPKTAASRLQSSSMSEVTSARLPGFPFSCLAFTTYLLPIGGLSPELVYVE